VPLHVDTFSDNLFDLSGITRTDNAEKGYIIQIYHAEVGYL